MSFSPSLIHKKAIKNVFAIVSDSSWLLSLSTNTGIIIYLLTLNCWQSTEEIFSTCMINGKKVESWRINIWKSQKWSVFLEKPLGRCARIRQPRIQIGVAFHYKYMTSDISLYISNDCRHEKRALDIYISNNEIKFLWIADAVLAFLFSRNCLRI